MKKLYLLFVFLFLSVSQFVLFAQPPGPGNPLGGAVPVDGGLAFLLAAGAGYGANKAYDYRKKKKDS